jgi:hypothetical protein
MRSRALPALMLTFLLSGCLTPEQQRAADEERCRSYGFTKRNDAFAECMQRIDLARRARLNSAVYVDGVYGRTLILN